MILLDEIQCLLIEDGALLNFQNRKFKVPAVALFKSKS